jgi:hypothetical protein
VNVVVGVTWEIVVDDQTDVWNVETTSRNVGGDKDACGACAEACQVIDTLTLLQAGV